MTVASCLLRSGHRWVVVALGLVETGRRFGLEHDDLLTLRREIAVGVAGMRSAARAGPTSGCGDVVDAEQTFDAVRKFLGPRRQAQFPQGGARVCASRGAARVLTSAEGVVAVPTQITGSVRESVSMMASSMAPVFAA